MSERLISIDIGTTCIKVVKLKNGNKYCEEHLRKDILKVVHRAVEKDYDALILTGSGASAIEGDKYCIDKQCMPIYRMNELECVGHIIPHMGYSEGLVVNMGTGTAFMHYKDGKCQHVTGTGIGGGTFEGLSQRLLKLDDPRVVESMASQGDLEKVNIVMEDIYEENLGWLHSDITVSNFAKSGIVDEDVAAAIHSVVIEPIMSMLKAILFFHPIEHVVFTGGVMNNKEICKLAEKYAEFFNFDYESLEDPSYATAMGAIELYKEMEK